MSEQITETGRTLVPEANYTAMINAVKRKNVREFVIYEWSFEAVVDDKPFYFGIGLFSSQMTDLLRALGAEEIALNKFKWDDEAVVGLTLNFNLVHLADKKGTLREQLSDIKLMTEIPKTKPKSVEEIQWDS